jgi:hypothetical protein
MAWIGLDFAHPRLILGLDWFGSCVSGQKPSQLDRDTPRRVSTSSLVFLFSFQVKGTRGLVVILQALCVIGSRRFMKVARFFS